MFYNEISDFHENLETIRLFIASLEPVLFEKRKQNFKENAEDLSVLLLLLDEIVQDSNIKLSEDTKLKIKDNFDGEIIIEHSKDGNGASLKVDGNGGERFNKAFNNFTRLEEQKILLYKSSLMSIISTVECFLADVLKAYFGQYKKEITSVLISKKDKQFTLDELESFGNIDDAKEYIIDSKIENIIRGSLQDWVDFLKDKLHLNMGYLKDDKDEIIEIFQRRNIIVHNKGIVNSIYLSNVASKYRNIERKDHMISLNREYLENAINLLELNFSLIAFELWKNKLKDDKKRYHLLVKMISNNLEFKRWNIIKGLTIFLDNDSFCSQKQKMFSKINNWLSYKRLGEFEKIKDKVIDADFTACTLDFQVCQKALLDDNENVFELMREALEKNILNFKDIERWPVFEEFREDQLYTRILEMVDNSNEKVNLAIS